MKWPNRTTDELAARGKTTTRRVLLALGYKYRADKGMTLTEAVQEMGFTRTYGRSICSQFGIEFPDYNPSNPYPTSLD